VTPAGATSLHPPDFRAASPQYACDRITVGCRKYTDADWLSRVRRWPPSMVAALSDFLSLKHS
jgi:hypothetical protein